MPCSPKLDQGFQFQLPLLILADLGIIISLSLNPSFSSLKWG